MADRNPDSGLNQMIDQAERAGRFRSEGYQSDAALRCVLPAIEILDRRRYYVLARMGAARPVVWRDVRPLHVYAGKGRVRYS